MKIALIFAGQGAQYAGMGKDLYDAYPIARKFYDQAEDILKTPIKDICFNGPEDKLKATENAQPAILLISYTIYKILESEGLISDTFAGFSLGEYSALASAGVIKFEDAIKLVRDRGLIMDEAVKGIDGGMAAILGLEDEQVEEICSKVDGLVVPANYNCPGQLVISGEKSAVEKACDLAESMDAKRTVILNVSGPFHSPLLEKASLNLKNVLDKIEFLPMGAKKILSNVTAEYHVESKIKEALVRQMYSPVRWRKTIENLISEGYDTFIEIGPGKTLSGFMKSIDRSKTALNSGNVETIQKTLENIKK
ncbi:MAG TPA: ACP S-malonyltransferase [Spirochaetota bacterium]|jgi:[acyl-carrier-protein] S-malonyltransferase|nr:MAG: Malonyl CoA-acyl carrier protein transacylase [Spirochaetes bacterium ADurb.Bin133]HNZ26421.1 ACP S-malonyltransferase [Spirochaetota bacterium]HPY87787.1 ACP S-malonyltransferase [Spirochaetota bacterium]HQB60950.1 ACP S-malonyltransferase [Spirochaetota bacterium]